MMNDIVTFIHHFSLFFPHFFIILVAVFLNKEELLLK